MRRLHLCDRGSILKGLVIYIGACTLGLLIRTLLGVETPKAFKDMGRALIWVFASGKMWLRNSLKPIVWLFRTVFRISRHKPSVSIDSTTLN
jgi:hypothetical protein